MKDKLYTKAEAIVKIQSGEWKEAISMIDTGWNMHFDADGILKISSEKRSQEEIYHTIYFGETPQWAEHKPEALFNKTSDEALIGIFNRGEIWERIGTELVHEKPTVRRRALDGVCWHKIPENSLWRPAPWTTCDREGMWRKAENQEVES